ncbi:uncharacterized protein TNCV_4013561 [Trichonephila clavipes]|nr:uncharacterized protein TNCV_4013561 [Trichonephila clavipes]
MCSLIETSCKTNNDHPPLQAFEATIVILTPPDDDPISIELLPQDCESRHLFSLQFLACLEVDPEWPWNILWTDEAHFHLDGSVNTHNCRIWESDNPHSTLQDSLHSPKVTVWCGFSTSFILGPYFFQKLGAGGPVTCSITGQRYASLLRNKIIPDLQLVSCDQPRTSPDLKDSISRHVLNNSQNTLRSTVEHAVLRFKIVSENDGHHDEPLLFIAAHSSCSANRSSRIVTGDKVRSAKRLPRKSHTCSMELRSGDRASQSIRSISHSLRAVRQLLCDDMVHCSP